MTSLFACAVSPLWSCHNTLRPRQNGRHFPDDTFEHIFLNENVRISIKISLKFVPKGPIHNTPALVPIMAWRRSGDKPFSEPMIVNLLTHICVTRPQSVNTVFFYFTSCRANSRFGPNSFYQLWKPNIYIYTYQNCVWNTEFYLTLAGCWVQIFAWTSIAQSVWEWAFSLLEIWCLRLPSFESCIQQRKTNCLLSIRNHFPCSIIVAVSVYFICLCKYKYIYFLKCVVLDVTTHVVR